MATNSTTTSSTTGTSTTSTLKQGSQFPEIMPGGAITGNDLISGGSTTNANLTQQISNITNTLNLLIQTVNNPPVSPILTPNYLPVGGQMFSNLVTQGNTSLRKMADGQYVAIVQSGQIAGGGAVNSPDGAAGTYILHRAFKSLPPYANWTGLAGEPYGTAVYSNTGGSDRQFNNAPAWYQDSASQDIYFCYVIGGGYCYGVCRFAYNVAAQTWAFGDYAPGVSGGYGVINTSNGNTVQATLSRDMPDMVYLKDGTNLFVDYNQGYPSQTGTMAVIAKRTPTALAAGQSKNLWTIEASIHAGANGFGQGGYRIVELAGGYALGLFQGYADKTVAGLTSNIFWAMRTPAGVWSSVPSNWVSPGNATVNIGGVAQNTSARSWNAVFNPVSGKVGLIFHTVSGSGLSAGDGVLYTEFTPVYGTSPSGSWSPAIKLFPFAGEQGVTLCVDNAGVFRALWGHVTGGYVAAWAYCRSVASSGTNALSGWNAPKIFDMASQGIASGGIAVAEQMTGLDIGLDTVGGVSVWPVLYVRHSLSGFPYTGDCAFKVLPVAALDALYY